MKKIVLIIAVILVPAFIYAQCSTTNATGCLCPDGTQDCLLLPDIKVSGNAFQTYDNGPNEYPQTNAGTSVNGQGPDDGRLRLCGSTPNVGYGPMEVRAVDRNNRRWFLCGTDTFNIIDANGTSTFTCPNGYPNPRQLLKQRVYQKSGATMTFSERFAGSMTYHPTHQHYHVDEWEIMTLRIQDPNEPDPLKWQILGRGNKVGFCIEDYKDCSSAPGHCEDSIGGTLLNNDFPNFGLGGGNYSCGLKYQGITVGWTDIYWETLDGQWLNIPPNTCNGQYYVVIQVDPNNYFLESDETNNYFAEPVTLTMQSPAGNPVIQITSDLTSSRVCEGDSITLTATAGSATSWSTGATTQSVKIPAPVVPTTYTATVTNHCGTGTASYTVNPVPAPAAPTITNALDTICGSGSVTITANGSGTLKWYDANGNYLTTGTSFTTPTITTSTTYYVENIGLFVDTLYSTPHNNGAGSGDYVTSAQYLIFNADVAFTLLSVKTYAGSAGNRIIQLQDSTGAVIQTITVNMPSGVSRATLNFNVPQGKKYRLACTGNPDLFRNNAAGISYPYGIDNIVTVTGSSGGASYYYFFYDWKVATQANTCASVATPVTAVVDQCLGFKENIFKNTIAVFPNPSNGNFFVSFEIANAANVLLNIYDIVGKNVYAKNINAYQGKVTKEIEAGSLAKGIYSLSITYDGKPYFTKLVIQ